MSQENLSAQLKEIDPYSLLVIAERILQRIVNGDIPDDMNLPDDYEALNILLVRINNLEDNFVARAEELKIEVNEESLVFLRGILSGALIASATLAEYAENQAFTDNFDDRSFVSK